MEQSVKQQIAQKVSQYMADHELSQSEVSLKTGVRKEYLSTILKENSDFTYSAGNSKGAIPAKHFHSLAEFVGFTTEKVYWEVKATEQLTAMLSILEDAKQYGYYNVIIGETGAGKTQAAQLFAKKNPADVFIITVGSSDNLADLLDKVIDALKIPSARTKSKKLTDIANEMKRLRRDGYEPVLIFDESEYMKQPALCSQKELYDKLHTHCAIILVGTEQLIRNIDTLRKRNKAGIPQFYRRIKFGIRTLPSIDRSYTMFLTEVDKNIKSFLQGICDNYGELHDVIVPTLREADRLKQPLSEQLIKKVLNLPDRLPI